MRPFNPNYPNEPKCKLLKPKGGNCEGLSHRPMLYQLSYAHHRVVPVVYTI